MKNNYSIFDEVKARLILIFLQNSLQKFESFVLLWSEVLPMCCNLK